MKKPIEVKKKLKKVTEYTACFAFLMFLQGVGAPMVFADATAAINAKFEILWNLISAVVQSVGGVIFVCSFVSILHTTFFNRHHHHVCEIFQLKMQ